jgi:hypothetical protein
MECHVLRSFCVPMMSRMIPGGSDAHGKEIKLIEQVMRRVR